MDFVNKIVCFLLKLKNNDQGDLEVTLKLSVFDSGE